MRKPKPAIFWQFIKNEASDRVGELILYGVISDSIFFEGMSAKKFADELKGLGDIEEIRVRINSPGGDVFAAQAIYNLLKAHPAQVTVYIDGLAASAASVVAMAGDTIIMPGNAMMMIHNPWIFVGGDADALRSMADVLDQVRETLIAVYQDKTDMERDTLIDLLKEETWFTATEALEYGLVDEIAEPIPIAACADKDVYLINGQRVDLTAIPVQPKLDLPNPISAPKAGPERTVTMKAREFLAKIRGWIPGANAQVVSQIDTLRADIADDASVETVLDQVGGAVRAALQSGLEFANACREAGVETVDQVKNLADRAKLGDQYRTDLINQTLAAGVRAQGGSFQSDFFRQLLNEPARSVDDIKVFLTQFEEQAKARLGDPGRQTTPPDPNAPLAGNKDFRSLSAEEFDKLPKAEQDAVLKAYNESRK